MMFLMEKSKAGADCAASGSGARTANATITAGARPRARPKKLPITGDFNGGLAERRAASAIAKKCYSENYHPERKQIIVDRGDGGDDAAHVAKHPDQPGHAGEDAEESHPARKACAGRKHSERRKQKEDAEAELSEEFSNVVAEKAVQPREDGGYHRLLRSGCHRISLGERPMNARPAQQSQHHADCRHHCEKHC